MKDSFSVAKDLHGTQIGYGSNRKTKHLIPSGHKVFLVNNTRDVDILLMHNQTYAATYVDPNSQSSSESRKGI